MLNKKEKEELVAKLYQDGKPIREIARQAHLSFGTIGKIVRRLDGVENNEIISSDMKNKSKTTQALSLFLQGKRPVEAAIELDLSASEIEDILQEFWVLNQLDELALVYLDIKNYLDLFLRLFHELKNSKLTKQKDIKLVLRYAAFDLPALENRIYTLTNDVINLEDKKRDLIQRLVLWNAQLSDLGRAIEIKNEELKVLGNLN